ncbi:MAG TPA: helix-turn-helix domain-containing protein [Bacteroidia bacterium]|nr:helix-turn-helix domain-containing protein [Bacteroidia bacterium]HRD38205.1 helix-turn-helix domain-containing protein [Bacteroidia bacterium]
MESAEKSPAEIAAAFINRTNKNVFLTGKAGTGKTTFLKHIVSSTHKKCVVAAPTGIAAINAGGVTLHSLFQLPFGAFVPGPLPAGGLSQYIKVNDKNSLLKELQLNSVKRNLLREIELLIIDEVSMLRSDLLDAIDVILRSVRRNYNSPFGGLQILFIGDLLQLPPVVKEEEWQLLQRYYNSPYFFDALVLRQHKPVYVELNKIYRQDDETFIQLLNHLRSNKLTVDDIALLNSYYKEGFKPKPEENYITLTTHNIKADRINKEYLNELKSSSYFYKAIIEGDFNENSFPVELNMELKVGAQVMFVKNDPSGAQRFFNGKIGVVENLTEKEIWVACNDSTKPISVERYEWQNIKYSLDVTSGEITEKVVGKFLQYPLKLAWAITVHKSQGLTFDKAIIDIDKVFAPGQAYVALSRLRSLNGLVLNERINYKGIETDAHVKSFSDSKQDQDELVKQIDNSQTDYLRDVLLKAFDFYNLNNVFQNHAISYDQDKKKSAKTPQKEWALQLKDKTESLQTNGSKFLTQINAILGSGVPDFKLLNERVEAAINYFEPILSDLQEQILNKIKELNAEKRIKVYLEELLELEAVCFLKSVELKKAFLFSKNIPEGKSVLKEEIKALVNSNVREQRLAACLQRDAEYEMEREEKLQARRERRKKRKEKSSEEEESTLESKVSTQEQSFLLFKDGHDVESIAKMRGMALSTIEGHLVPYVAKGFLSASQFVSDEKSSHILEVAKKLNTYKLGEIKNALGDEYTYTDIKFALAAALSES